MAEVSPLPIRGEVVLDARGGARAMRVSWHPDQGMVVLSIWRGNTCVGTVQVDSAEVPHLVDVLVRGLASGPTRAPSLEDAG
ncbi:MAG TPA: hypothetical protein VES93_16840 [Ornithinibacter sp.]|nr:hypothetical protein [Ornithinibacter sp.]